MARQMVLGMGTCPTRHSVRPITQDRTLRRVLRVAMLSKARGTRKLACRRSFRTPSDNTHILALLRHSMRRPLPLKSHKSTIHHLRQQTVGILHTMTTDAVPTGRHTVTSRNIVMLVQEVRRRHLRSSIHHMYQQMEASLRMAPGKMRGIMGMDVDRIARNSRWLCLFATRTGSMTYTPNLRS